MQLSKHSVIRKICPQIVLGRVVLNFLEKDEKHQSKYGSPWYYSNTNKNDRRKAQVNLHHISLAVLARTAQLPPN